MDNYSEDLRKRYEDWLAHATEDQDLIRELQDMKDNTKAVTDAFYKNLAFGTGGLRGVIGAGTNRMNIYTVGKASQGLADYVLAHFPSGSRSIAISYDSRIKSREFAEVSAEVFSANGIQVHIYKELMPTPMLSWAVRKLGCSAGVMITASHNPSKYNGYKVYGADGCQITTEAAAEILSAIERIEPFCDVRRLPLKEGLSSGIVSYIEDAVIDFYMEAVKGQCLQKDLIKDAAIVYSPLNGTGLMPVLRALKESGFTNITVVKEQEQPDGNFPTCPYPNPEIREAMALGIQYAKDGNADLLLATDPDCDRVGIAVKNRENEFVLLSGNEVGMLLLDYICKQRTAAGTMPEHPVFMKTIVTIDMASRIAADYGVATVDVLTGFKFIGEQIGFLEEKGREKDYILGFEESYGYLSGSYVRDKDGVNAALLICEMFAFYKTLGKSLLDVLEELYEKYGYCLNTLHSYEFDGIEGFEKMQKIMEKLHNLDVTADLILGGRKAEAVEDYLSGRKYYCDGTTKEITGLPASDVLKFRLEGNCSLVVRPSGTEPKLKLYLSVSAKDRSLAEEAEQLLKSQMEQFFAL